MQRYSELEVKYSQSAADVKMENWLPLTTSPEPPCAEGRQQTTKVEESAGEDEGAEVQED